MPTAHSALGEWSGRKREASPFGICVRPADSQHTESPFPAWEYRPTYLPDSIAMHIGEAGVEGPMWIYPSFMRRVDREQRAEVAVEADTAVTSHADLANSVNTSRVSGSDRFPECAFAGRDIRAFDC
jgi:hypothetical protein